MCDFVIVPSMDADGIIAALKRLGVPHERVAEAIDRERSVATKLLGGSRSMKAHEIPPLQALVAEYEVERGEVDEHGRAPDEADERLAVFRSDLIVVPEYDVRLSAGGGSLIEAENQSGVWQFSRRYLVEELRLAPANLAIVEVQGDSMEPTLRTGDRVLIDHSDRNPARPGVYAIWDSNATVVKRLERIPASDPPMVVLISDNKNHNAYTVPAELVNVIGRVVWFARRL